MQRLGFVVLLIVCGAACHAAAPMLHLGYSDVETFPYQMGNGAQIAKLPGVAIDVIRQAAEDIGVEVQFQRLPNKRVLTELKFGGIDGAFIFSDNEERRTFARYPLHAGRLDAGRRIARLAYYLYRLQGDPVSWNGRQMTGLKGVVGANSGFSIVDDLKKLGVPVEEAKTTEQNLAKLQMGRITALAAQDTMTDPHIAKLANSNIEKLPIPIVSKDYFLIFSRAYADKNNVLVEKLWDRIGEIRDRKTREVLVHYLEP